MSEFKSKALEWLIENVTKWPTARGGIVSSPDGWSWGKSPDGDVWLFRDIPTVLYTDCYIKEQEWLDGSLVEQHETVTNVSLPMSRDDAFDWVYNNFSKHMGEWPVYGVDCRTLPRPGEWSWYIPTNRGKCLPGTRAILAGPPTVDCEHITFENVMKYVKGEQRDVNQAKLREVIGRHIIYYIAGPMSGLPNFNRDNFNRIASELDGAILNPATLPDGLSQRDYMSICLPMVQASTHMFMLNGWENSPGALAEHSLAVKLKLEIEYE